MNNQNQFSGNSESLFVENLPQKKVKIETECEETDRISKLPYAIIVQILSLLSITDVFRTTVLYKDWQYFWTCINNIVYDNKEYGHLDNSTLHKFISLTDNVLPLLSFSSIKKLSFNFVFRYGDGLSYFPVIDKWLEFVVNKKVEDLCMNIRHRSVYPIGKDQPYSFPEVLCSSHPPGDWYPFENDNDTCCFEIVSPYVEHLTISRGFNYKKIKHRDLSSWNHANLNLYFDEFAERDENIVKDFFVSVHCANELILSSWKYLSLEENIFKVVLQNLKNVKVMPLCSHTDTSDATKLDQFLKFLLEHAINLEKLVIVPEHKECNSCSTDTSNLKKNLLAFSTTSISAIISLES
ncbi:hypothetical protein H5410_005581 [Solanum commersonii]|uniref:F-box domain-containing protein n=1 Tax=Solanum commersonii TaxID=4109 RepID=A0A9J6A7U7_SOLCO|nr:hypothetical protein H5410_005581 [Solanum commersonii]